jgi:hypothetical protein
MSGTPNWTWPPSGASARAASLVPYGSGFGAVIALDWRNPTAWPFGLSGTSQAPVPLPTGPANPLFDLGLVAGVYDSTYGAVGFGWNGTSWAVAAGAGTVYGNAASGMYVGAAETSDFLRWAVSTKGTLTRFSTTTSGQFAVAPWFLVAGGTTLYSLLPSIPAVGTMTEAGVSGQIALPSPFQVATCLFASGSIVAVGGWQQLSVASGAAAIAADPAVGSLALSVGSGKAIMWQAPAQYSDAWSPFLALTGLANLTALSWSPGGTQILATDPVSGVVQVIGFVGGVLSLSQTLSVVGAGSVAVLPDSANALVCQPASNAVLPLVATAGVWAVSGSAVSGLHDPLGVVAVDSATAVVSFASGAALLVQTGGLWSIAATGALSFLPLAHMIAADPQGLAYIAGSGAFAVVSGVSLVGSGTLAVAPTSMSVSQGRLAFGQPSLSGVSVYGQTSPGAWTRPNAVATGAPSGTPLAVGFVGSTLFAAGIGATNFFALSGTPYQLQPVPSGLVGIYNGSSWATGALGATHNPAALALDVSGHISVVTTDNYLFSFTTSGAIASSGLIAPYAGQTAGTPFGLSALLLIGSGLYASTLLAGALVQVL